MKGLLWDIKFGIRMLFQHRVFTLTIVLTLAIGIGANTSIFSVINALMLRELPVKNPQELVVLSMKEGTNSNPTFSYPIYEKLQDGNRSLSSLCAASAGASRRRMISSEMGGADVEFVQAQEVTGNFFSVLGVEAIVGRTLTLEDDQKENPQPVAVISHTFWQRRFGGDPSIIGKTITLDDVALTLIGVTPPGFFGIEVGGNPDLWYPMQMVLQVDANPEPSTQKLSQYVWWLRVMGRVPTGVDTRQAQAEIDIIYQEQLDEEYARNVAEGNSQRERSQSTLVLQPGNIGWTDLRGQLRQPLWVLMVASGLVMLIACANVASLLLARASMRMREFSIRNALGASRLQLIRQMMTESMLLAILGGMVGILFAQWGTDLLLFYTKIQNNLISFNVSPDKRVLFFTVAISLLSGLLSGLPYALRSSRLDIHTVLKSSSNSVGSHSSRQFVNRSLVVMQLALSIVLLIGAGLFIRTLGNLRGLDAGFNRENIVLFDFDFTKNLDKSSRTTFYKTLLERIEPMPGVQTVSLSVIQPFSRAGWGDLVSVDGQFQNLGKNPNRLCFGMWVGPDFFQTMGTPLLSGREFDSREGTLSDAKAANVAHTVVVNETLARRYFPNENPLGKKLYLKSKPDQTFDIIGVVKDTKYNSLREATKPIFYMPFFQEPEDWGMTFAVRTNGDSRPLISSLQALAREIDSNVQIRDLRTMEDVVNTSLHQEWTIAQLGSFFSAIALALACLGLYSVLSFSVTQRTREIGIRMALGAQPFSVLSLIVGQGLLLAIIGLSLGLFAALALTRIVSNLLYGISPTDPITFISVSLLLVGVALLACYIPARRATRVDPMTALRCE